VPDSGIAQVRVTLHISPRMFPLSRRSLVILNCVGFALAGAGWISAWSKSPQSAEASQAAAADPGKAANPSKRGGGQGNKDPRVLEDPRSVRLLGLMAEMGKAATPGEPNAKFLNAAALTLEDSSFHRRKRDFSILLDKMTKDDAPAIHRKFVELEGAGRPFSEEYAAFATRWGQIDGAGVMAYFSEHGPFLTPNDMREVMAGWGSSRPEEAMAWIAEHKDLVGDTNAYRPVVAGWLQKDPAAATGWLASANLSRQEIGDCLVGATLDKLYSDGIEGMSEWLASLPDDNEDLAAAARQGWNGNQDRFKRLTPEQAATAWSHVGAQPWMGVQEFGQFCGSVARANEGELGGFVEALSTKWPASVVTAQFERWTEQDPGQAGVILSRMPPSDFRAAGIKGMIDKLQKTNPAAAAEWQQRLAP